MQSFLTKRAQSWYEVEIILRFAVCLPVFARRRASEILAATIIGLAYMHPGIGFLTFSNPHFGNMGNYDGFTGTSTKVSTVTKRENVAIHFFLPSHHSEYQKNPFTFWMASEISEISEYRLDPST